MKSMLTFIGGVAVGILAVTGIYALEDDGTDGSCEEVEEMDDEGLENNVKDEKMFTISGL